MGGTQMRKINLKTVGTVRERERERERERAIV